MHSMYRAGVPLPSSMLRQPIHFAPGAMPIWLACAVIADRGAGGVRAVTDIVARERRIVAASDYRRCHGWNRASCNRDRRLLRPSRGNAA